MQVRTKAHIAVLVANIFYGINFSIMQYLTPKLMQPIALNVLRVVGATLLFWGVRYITPTTKPIHRKHWGRLILCAATGVVINQILFVKGVTLTTTIRASLLMLVCPIAVVCIASVLHKEKLSINKIIGLALGILGAILLISLREHTTVGKHVILGDSFIIINALSYAVYLVAVKPLMQYYPPLQVIRWAFTLACVVMIPMGAQGVAAIAWGSFAWYDWAALMFIIIAVTFCTFLFTLYGIQVLGSSITGAYIYAQPVFAALVAVVILHDVSYWPIKLLAAICIGSGVYLVSYYNRAV